MPDYSYAKEKLNTAIYVLAIGRYDVRSRLFSAYLGFFTLKEDDFPEEFKEDWKWIMSKLTKNKPLRDYKEDIIEGSVQQSLKHMQNRTGAKIACKIYEIHEGLEIKY